MHFTQLSLCSITAATTTPTNTLLGTQQQSLQARLNMQSRIKFHKYNSEHQKGGRDHRRLLSLCSMHPKKSEKSLASRPLPVHSRQIFLGVFLFSFSFDCQCDGCVTNLPTMQDISKQCQRFVQSTSPNEFQSVLLPQILLFQFGLQRKC